MLTLSLAPEETPADLWAGLGAADALRVRRKTVEQALTDAHVFVGEGKYIVGAGADVFSPTPFDERRATDCSAYTSWVTGHSRRQPNGTYNTTNMVRDAYEISSAGQVRGMGPRLLYDPVAYASAAQELSLVRIRPGDLIVRPWIGDVIGHSGFVVGVRRDPRYRWWQNLTISQMGLYGVKIGDATAWKDRPVFIIRPRYYTAPARVAGRGGGMILVGALALAGGYAYYRYSRRGRLWG